MLQHLVRPTRGHTNLFPLLQYLVRANLGSTPTREAANLVPMLGLILMREALDPVLGPTLAREAAHLVPMVGPTSPGEALLSMLGRPTPTREAANLAYGPQPVAMLHLLFAVIPLADRL